MLSQSGGSYLGARGARCAVRIAAEQGAVRMLGWLFRIDRRRGRRLVAASAVAATMALTAGAPGGLAVARAAAPAAGASKAPAKPKAATSLPASGDAGSDHVAPAAPTGALPPTPPKGPAGPAAVIVARSGNRQAARPAEAFPSPFVVGVADRYGRPVAKAG